MRVLDLKPGARFRILQKIYVLQRKPTPCSATVEVEAGDRVVKIGDVEFTAPASRRITIAPTAEVDEYLGQVAIKEREVKEHVDELEEARKAIQRQERKERAKAREQEVA